MVEAEPTFEEVAAALSTRISGSLLVAHNLAFDVRMLAGEDLRDRLRTLATEQPHFGYRRLCVPIRRVFSLSNHGSATTTTHDRTAASTTTLP